MRFYCGDVEVELFPKSPLDPKPSIVSLSKDSTVSLDVPDPAPFKEHNTIILDPHYRDISAPLRTFTCDIYAIPKQQFAVRCYRTGPSLANKGLCFDLFIDEVWISSCYLKTVHVQAMFLPSHALMFS